MRNLENLAQTMISFAVTFTIGAAVLLALSFMARSALKRRGMKHRRADAFSRAGLSFAMIGWTYFCVRTYLMT